MFLKIKRKKIRSRKDYVFALLSSLFTLISLDNCWFESKRNIYVYRVSWFTMLIFWNEKVFVHFWPFCLTFQKILTKLFFWKITNFCHHIKTKSVLEGLAPDIITSGQVLVLQIWCAHFLAHNIGQMVERAQMLAKSKVENKIEAENYLKMDNTSFLTPGILWRQTLSTISF